MDPRISELANEYRRDAQGYMDRRHIRYNGAQDGGENMTVTDRDTNTTVYFAIDNVLSTRDLNGDGEPDTLTVLRIRNINGDDRISPEDLERFKTDNAELYAMFAARVGQPDQNNLPIQVVYLNQDGRQESLSAAR